jgi:excisionase family DNA binding protein
MADDDLIPVSVVAEKLGCSRRHILNLINQGEIGKVRIGSRDYQVSRESFSNFLDRRKTGIR